MNKVTGFVKKTIMPLTAVLAVMALSACGGKSAPDEFMVLKSPPLVVPPDFHLRPPGDDNELRDRFLPQAQARRALFGG